MLLTHFRYPVAIAFLAVSFLFLVCSGCQKQIAPQGKKTVTFDCGNQTVNVVAVQGTDPKAVYLCEGDTLTWLPNNQKFTATFKKGYPFIGPPTTFTNNPDNLNAGVTSPPAKHSALLVVYHYDMTINGVAVEDPQVIGGGGHSSSLTGQNSGSERLVATRR